MARDDHVGEGTADPLTLLVYSAESLAESSLYEDSGDGFGYERGEYSRRRVTSEVRRGTIAVRIGEREGSFIPQRKFIHLELRSVYTRPESVSANGEEADWGYDEADGKITVRLAESSGAIAVELGF